MLKKDEERKIDYRKLNDVITLSKKILKIAYILIAILGIYAITLLFKEWKIMNFVFLIIKIVSPLFIGIIIAWLFDPFVRKLKRKGIRRGIGATITYILLIGTILIVIGSIIPLLSDQINEFAKTIPNVFDSIKVWIDNLFERLAKIDNFDVNSFKSDLFLKIEEFATGLTNSLPDMTVNFLKSLFSGLGTIVIGLIIGFYLLISFDNVNDFIYTVLPKRMQNDTRDLLNEVNTSLRSYVQGAVIDCTFVFIISAIGFAIIGLKAPLLFGLFCGLTNIIPYAGPYIGGAPAVIVGFSINPTVGILALIVVFVIQFIEGNFLQPIIMSKTTKLHPVTIMLGLLVFGYFWGIIGMIVSTPIIASTKSILMFFDEKYNILTQNE